MPLHVLEVGAWGIIIGTCPGCLVGVLTSLNRENGVRKHSFVLPALLAGWIAFLTAGLATIWILTWLAQAVGGIGWS